MGTKRPELEREGNPNWQGGRSVASNGYVLIRVGTGHHLADVRGYAYEHRLAAEAKIGRRLTKGEQIHHINGDKTDNRPENLEVAESIRHHRVKHRRVQLTRRLPGQSNELIECACGCGTKLEKFDSNGRPRKFVSGHNGRQGAPDNSQTGPFICTYSGLQLHLDAPSVDEICIEDIAHSLSLLCRFNGQCSHFYSVAQHSLHVSELAEAVAPYGGRRIYATAGLFHDAAEAYMGDITSPVKLYLPQVALLEGRILDVICKRFAIALPFPDAIKRIDNQMLATEAGWLMHEHGIWSEISDIAMIDFAPLPSKLAEDKFLERFNELAIGKA